MRVVMVSKALVVGAYQRKAEELAGQGVELTVLVPPAWGDRRGRQPAERLYTAGYTLRIIPLRFNGNFHLHYYPTLGAELAALRPDLLHMDEEPYNLATWLGLRAARRLGIPALFFTWQNLLRRYPPPFAQWEQANYRGAAAAIAGSAAAGDILRAKGYAGPLAVIPQFGVDPVLFCPPPRPAAPPPQPAPQPFTVGYAGGLVPEKGVDLLIAACAGLPGDWRLLLAGTGEAQASLAAQAQALGVAERVEFTGRHAADAMPAFYRRLDVLVLPSRTLPNWKEQFGRVLIEAMACAVPVVGSDSGEIPHVLGGGGLVFPEGDSAALGQHLRALAADPGLRQQLGAAGRARVLEHFTMASIARRTVALYRTLLCAQPSAQSQLQSPAQPQAEAEASAQPQPQPKAQPKTEAPAQPQPKPKAEAPAQSPAQPQAEAEASAQSPAQAQPQAEAPAQLPAPPAP